MEDKLNESLIKSFESAKSNLSPTVILCHTVKGKGVSFMENSVLWHYRSPKDEEYIKAKNELNKEK